MLRSLLACGGLAAAIAACAAPHPGGISDVEIQASTAETSQVHYIEITVHELATGELVYDSGLRPTADFQDTRQMLDRDVMLTGATDYLFDASAYETSDPSSFLKAGNTVQEATQPAGHPTTVLIVIDLNAGGTNPTSETVISAVSDNIPMIAPPTIAGTVATGQPLEIDLTGSDADLDADAGPIDPGETLTFFTTVLSGNVDLSANSNPGLFTPGQAFQLTILDDQPVELLSAVVDKLNQLTFVVTEIDPRGGGFATIETGEGYALFDGDGVTYDPANPPVTGPIACLVVKHGVPDGGHSVEIISRADDSMVRIPTDTAYWDGGLVQSFNRYQEADGSVDFKLRVAIPTPPGTANPPVGGSTVDALKIAEDTTGHFGFTVEAAEAGAVLPAPSIDGVTASGGGSSFSPGDPVVVSGSSFTAAIPAATPFDSQQVYLAMGGTYAYPTSLSSPDPTSEVDFTLPADLASGTWDLVVCTYGHMCVTSTAAISVAP